MTDYQDFASVYDLDYGRRDEDVAFYASLAREQGSPVLELACGTGRLALSLARDGFAVWGLDNSSAMLRVFVEKLRSEPKALQRRVRLVLADMRGFAFARGFPLIVLAFRTFQHLETKEDQLRALRSARRHLSPGGVFVVSAYTVPMKDLAYPDRMQIDLKRTNPRTGNVVVRRHRVERDYRSQLDRVTFIYEERLPDGSVERTVKKAAMRFVFRSELTLLLELAGLRPLEMFGDYSGTPFAEGCRELIAVCERARGLTPPASRVHWPLHAAP